MKKKLLLLLLAVCILPQFCCCSEGNGPDAPNEPEKPKPSEVKCVSINGFDLIQSDGSRLFIKGTNLGHWLLQEGYMFNFSNVSTHEIDEMFRQLVGDDYTNQFWKDFLANYITLDDMKFIKSTGANTVRLPLNYRLFTDDFYMGSDDPDLGMELLDKVLDWCRQTGLYLIIDMHAPPGGSSGDKKIDDSNGYPELFTSEDYQRQYCEIWKRIAEHCCAEPIVLGYELLNEPLPNSHKDLFPKLQPLYKRVTKVIREIDPNHIVILGGANYNDDFTVFDVNDMAFDNKMIFAGHRYGSMYIDNFTGFRSQVNRPMIITEWGHGESWEWQTTFSKVLRDNNLGYTTWPYKMIEGMYGSFTYIVKPVNWDKIVEFEKAPRSNDDEIKKAREIVSPDVARKAMADFIENCKYANCGKYDGYIKSVRMSE